MSEKPRALMLLGPTACGKTAVSLMLAREFAAEIISVDSALIYRGMDIGTAKPTREEQGGVPHHLIDILDIEESYSAAAFAEDAERLIGEISGRDRYPLLVGGTMLYAKALREGMDESPATDPAVRERITALGEELGWPAMHERLTQVDPITAARLAPNDRQRVGRALEVFEITGKPLSSLHTGTKVYDPTLAVAALFPQDRAKHVPALMKICRPCAPSVIVRRLRTSRVKRISNSFSKAVKQRRGSSPNVRSLGCAPCQAW